MFNIDDDDIDNGLDDNEDLTNADRGDTIESPDTDAAAAAAQAKTDAAALRDADGKFKKAEPTAEEAAAATAKAEADAAAKAEAEAAEAPEDEDEDDAAGKSQNMALRLNKMREQRDRERTRADEATAAATAALTAAAAKAAPAREAKADPVVAIEASLDALYEQVETARADSDVKLSAQLQRQIDVKNREISEIRAMRIAQAASATTQDDARYDLLVDDLENKHPQLQPKHDDYDKALVQELQFTVAAFEKMGMRSSDALKKAAKMLLAAPAAVVEDTAAKDDGKVVPITKKVDVAKAVATSKKQPPVLDGVGTNKDDTTIDFEGLSEEEFEALPESKKAAARGDKF